jgi:hypothetical protein
MVDLQAKPRSAEIRETPFNPKVVGSIPTRPITISSMAHDEPLADRVCELLAMAVSASGHGRTMVRADPAGVKR